MRIAYVLTSLGMGGAERQVLAVAQRMAERGHAVSLLVLRPQLAEEWPTALPVFRLEMRRSPLSVFTGLLRGRRFLREFRPELLHSHSFHANFVARLLKLFQPDLTVISTIHNVYEGGWQRMLAYRLTDPLSARTTAVSAAAARRFVALKAVSDEKCQALTNGIDTREFAADPERREAMRSAMGAQDAFVWLAAGRIVPAKDFPNLLRAFDRARAARPEAQLWIAGGGDEKQLVAGSQPGDSAMDGVKWLGLRRDMVALLDAADGFVLASAWEGMPLAVGEAMAMEKPVVATDVGGVRELVGGEGLIVAAKNPEALAQAMLTVMELTAEQRAAMGVKARERIEGSFSIEAKTDEWEAVYAGVLGV